MIISQLKHLLQLVSRRSDIALIMLLIMTVFMIIMPMPTLLIDTLIGLNISLAVILLIVSIYLHDPLEFSTLPAVILISVIFRLSLSIATTRLILAQGDAGEIIQGFGSFVIFGNVIVGLVVFLIITVVHFLVIAKGSERVAEVAARFSLDGLPGKQMSIDSDLRNGSITMDQAQEKRHKLELTSQFYGAMDGAMKFVKGDAIAGLIITFVNLIGGLTIGIVQRGMSVSEALSLYSLLTIGDGLVAQIPALFIAITSGAIVTRVTTNQSRNLGADIVKEVIAKPIALGVAAGVLLLFSLVPGLPTEVFLGLALLFGGGSASAFSKKRKEQRLEPVPGPSITMDLETSAKSWKPMPLVALELSGDLRQQVLADDFQGKIAELRHKAYEDYGVWCPPVTLKTNVSLPAEGYQILLEGVVRLDGSIPSNRLLVFGQRETLQLAGIGHEPTEEVKPSTEVFSVAPEQKEALAQNGIIFFELGDALIQILEDMLPNYWSSFIGIQETKALLSRLSQDYDDLVKETLEVCPIGKLTTILCRLLDDGVSIRNLRAILQAIIEWAPREDDPIVLTEYVRTGLKAQLSFAHLNDQRLLPAYLLNADTEMKIRESIQDTSVGSYLTLDGDAANALVQNVKSKTGDLAEHQSLPVILTSLDIRRFVKSFLKSNGVSLPVLSHQDISNEVNIYSLGVISM